MTTAVGGIRRYLLSCAGVLAGTVTMLARASGDADAQWTLGDFAGMPVQKVALRVKALVGGHECRFQLDTGMNAAVTWHGYTPEAGNEVPLTVAFQGLAVTVPATSEFAARVAACREGDTVGTLGNALFEGGSLVIDLRAPAVSYHPGSRLASSEDAQPMFYVRWGPQGGHPLVELRRAGHGVQHALLDTGSAAMGLLVLNADDWDAATGGGAPLRAGESVRAFEIHAWGRQHVCYQGPAQGWQIGTAPPAALPVQHCPTLAFDPPIRLAGVLGLRPFGDAVITIDYPAGRWSVRRP